ncbi:5-3 exonuclease XRNC [Trypanosoma theileri]|uniref:5-3 exonuclease XRNC n=1 Tax=Trypanosoma theileri TaxID=67003 RepID=A0A1X0NX31_9TRYP|nr:5-3 exonuclease XRNC [Trypanosoma theileri]ORC89257.1 5-3 exonuclease XRNC [Trypanosoma theileri]
MGVPLLLTWLKRRFSSCFLPSNCNLETDCLYIDVNGLVYQSAALVAANEAAGVDMDAAILRKLFDLLDDIVLRLVRPRSLVYLAVDGISPMGKLAQQRSRRRRRRTNNNNNNYNNNNYYNNNNNGGGRSVEWDSNSISVGTPFMSRLTDALHFYCASRAERINSERMREYQRNTTEKSDTSTDETSVSPISFLVDDVWRPGEGENKIADAIRRFRSQPNYNPNTSHVICSSDTDVTVCSLILHEPRIHVLRYEYPVNNDKKSDSGNSWKNQTGDAWSCTFFSIHFFREELRRRLRLQYSTDTSSTTEIEKKSRQFERALHDVVFVLLLFGNDFLPSLGCRIEGGFLDGLLELLATDFISRDRSIIDPLTNTIQFDAARYALDSLAEMRDERHGGDGTLSINNGTEGGTGWGFEDAEFQQRKQAEEKEQAPRCYAYWTMLQWSLQNSAGVVEHWGCYYPYSTAPPLHLLRKYCGVLSYDALMQLAEKRSRADKSGSEVSLTTESTSAMRGSAGPTDVLVQLLVLLPARSVSLFPSAIRNAYAEIEHLVLAPVERLDFAAIEAWCEKKRQLFTEEERTRFRSYALCAGSTVLAGEKEGEPIRGNEMIFLADWNAEEFAEELKRMKTAKQIETTTNPVNRGLTSMTNSSLGSFTSSFFSSRPTRKTSAAAAALITTTSNESSDLNNCNNNTTTTTNTDTVHKGSENTAEQAVFNKQEVEYESSNKIELVQRSSFTVFAVSTNVLVDTSMIKGVGYITGDTFVCGQFTNPHLSRHSQTMLPRLQWRIASKPLLTQSKFVPDLLSGYNAPPLPSLSKNNEKPGMKRDASILDRTDNSDSDDSSSKSNEDKKKSLSDHVLTEIEKKKEAVWRRLEALQSRSEGTGN